jgi:hypothetical protein
MGLQAMQDSLSMTEMLEQWRDPVFNDLHQQVPARLAARLTEMGDEITASENVPTALAEVRIPNSLKGLAVGVTPRRIAALPKRLRIYYEQLHCLVALAGVASTADPSKFTVNGQPSDFEMQLGSVLGQAFHQGCPLADIALAADLPEDLVVAIGKRTIRGTGWLKRL